MSETETNETPTIHVLMARVMEDVGVVGKNSSGDVPYKFRGIDAVVNALNPAMVKHGVFCLPEVRHYEHERLANGRAHMVMLTVAYRFYGPRGDYVEAVGIGESVDYSDKATNQAMSMAYKYMLTETFCIRTEDMTDADARSVEIPEQKQGNRSGGKSNAQSSTRQQKQQPARAAEADKETGEIPEPPNPSAVIEKLSQEGRTLLEEKRVKANFPPVDQLAPAAAKQMIKWAEEIKAEQDKGAPFS